MGWSSSTGWNNEGWESASATQLLLDSLSVPASLAYSTRKLRSAYAGNALQVTTSVAGNATQNIGFAGSGDLDTGALTTFIGGNTGSVSIWNDQSGNVVNASRTIVSQQPIIDNAGSLIVQNTHVWLQATTANASILLVPSASVAQPLTVAILVKQGSGSNNGFCDGLGATRCRVNEQGTVYGMYADGTPLTGGTADATNVHTLIAVFNAASSVLYVDGVSTITGNPGTSGFINQTVFDGGSNAFIGEFLVFPSALSSSDRNLIRASWQSYWAAP